MRESIDPDACPCGACYSGKVAGTFCRTSARLSTEHPDLAAIDLTLRSAKIRRYLNKRIAKSFARVATLAVMRCYHMVVRCDARGLVFVRTDHPHATADMPDRFFAPFPNGLVGLKDVIWSYIFGVDAITRGFIYSKRQRRLIKGYEISYGNDPYVACLDLLARWLGAMDYLLYTSGATELPTRLLMDGPLAVPNKQRMENIWAIIAGTFIPYDTDSSSNMEEEGIEGGARSGSDPPAIPPLPPKAEPTLGLLDVYGLYFDRNVIYNTVYALTGITDVAKDIIGDRIMRDDDFALRRWSRLVMTWHRHDSIQDEVVKDLINHGFVSIGLMLEGPAPFRCKRSCKLVGTSS